MFSNIFHPRDAPKKELEGRVIGMHLFPWPWVALQYVICFDLSLPGLPIQRNFTIFWDLMPAMLTHLLQLHTHQAIPL